MPARRRRGWTEWSSSWVMFEVIKRASQSDLEPRAKRKIELAPMLVVVVALYGNTVVKAQWRAGHLQPQPEPEVVVVSPWVEVECGCVDKTNVVENGGPDRVHDLDRVLGREHAVGLAADRLGEDVARADDVVLEPAQVLGAAEVERVVVRQRGEAAVVVHNAPVEDQLEHLLLEVEHLEVLRAVEFELVELVGSAQRAARERRRDVDPVSGGRADDLVARVADDLEAEGGDVVQALVALDDGRRGRAHVVDVDDLVLVGEDALEEPEQGLAQVDEAALLELLVVRADVGGLLPEQAEAERERLLEQIGLLEADDRLVGHLAYRQLDAELLAVALEERAPVEQVEVRLLDLREHGRPLERAVARAECERPRPALLDRDAQVAPARDVGVLRLDLHVVEEAGVLEPVLAYLHPHRVKDVAGAEDELADDDDALRLRVALDLDRLDVELLALVDLELEVDVARLEVGPADDVDPRVEVPVLAVVVLHPLDGLVDL